VTAAKEEWKKASGAARKAAGSSARAVTSSTGGSRRVNPAAQRAKEMANRTGTAPGRFYADGKPRTTLSLAQLRTAVRGYAKSKGVTTRSEFEYMIALAGGLTQKGRNGLAVGRMPKTRGDWEQLYKSSVRLPEYNRGQRTRPGIVNGVDIHRDFRPWAVFGLNPKTATADDVNKAFRKLASQVHPDTGGRARDFARLKQMRDSVVALMPKPTPPKGSKRRATSKGGSSTPSRGPRILPPASSPKPRRKRRSS